MEKNGLAVPKAKTENLVTQDLPDEVLIYDLKTQRAYCLNQTAALVWKYCDGNTAVPEIAARLTNDLGMTVDEPTVWLAVNDLGKANLLDRRIASPAGGVRLGRRAAMRIGAAVAIPLVMSIVAPTAQAACSGNLALGGMCSVNSGCCSGCCSTNPGSPTSPICVTPLSILNNGSPCTMSCGCASGCCDSATSTCAMSAPGVVCFT